jgi:hypothetical protein
VEGGGDHERFHKPHHRVTAELHLLCDNITNAEVVRKMLLVVADHLTWVDISIETLLDIKNISVEEVAGMLRIIEQRCKRMVIHEIQGLLLLCEDEWMAKLKLCESEAKGGVNTNSGDSSGKKCGGRGHGRNNGESSNSGSRDGNKADSGGGPATKRDQHKRCGKHGHWARDCHNKPKWEAHIM